MRDEAPSTVEIAIGLPVHNAESTLPAALDALLAQTHRDFRVIALDDGSTDRSGEILREYADRDPRLEVITATTRTGLIRAWRRSAEIARDRYHPSFFAWYSDHDLVDTDWLEALRDALHEREDVVCAYAPARHISWTGEPIEHTPLTFDSSDLDPWSRLEASVGIGVGPLGAGDVVYGLFRMACLERCGIFRDELLPDRILITEIQLFGGIRCVDTTTRSRRMTEETLDLEATVERQLVRIFPEGVAPSHPALSHLTALLRTSLDPRLADDPDLRFRRSLQGWFYLLRHVRRFSEQTEREAAVVPWEGDAHLRAAIASWKGRAPFAERGVVETLEETVEELREEIRDQRTDFARSKSFHTSQRKRLERELRLTRWLGIFAWLGIRGRRVLRARRVRKRLNTKIPRPRVLFIVPESACEPALRFHGSTKDIRGRTEYFAERGLDVEELVTGRSETEILEALHRRPLREYGGIFIDIPGNSYPGVFRFLRAKVPDTVLIFRSHNAEFLHRWDWMRASRRLREKVRYLRRGLVNGLKDVLTSYYVDRVLAISDHDADRYWRRFAPRNKTMCAPYFIPAEYCEPPESSVEKELRCVALGSTARTPMIDEASTRFLRLVGDLADRAPDWTFSLTGEVDPAWEIPPRVEAVGLLDSPFEELHRSRVMALLSDRGRGFKTKILDAYFARAYVLMTPKIHRRLPEEVRPICIPVRARSVEDLLAALDRCREPYPDVPINDLLRDRAFRVLDEAFGITHEPDPTPSTPAEESIQVTT